MTAEKYFSFKSSDGLTDISSKYWLPEGEPKAILQIAHGMVEYKERYDGFAKYMTEHGFIVAANDHLGHGDSVISTSKLGYMTISNPSDVLMEDMHHLREIVQGDYPKLPYFILGHSMGSYLLRKYLAFHGEGLDGAIIMGTGQAGAGISKLALGIVSTIAKAKGWNHRSQFVQNLTYGKPYKKYDLTGNTPSNSWLTRDEAIVRKYYSDPKCTYLFTLTGHKGLFEMTYFDGLDENAAMIPKELPIYLVSGSEDPVGDLGEGVKKVEAQLKVAGIKDVSMKLFPGCRHEILNEINRDEVYEDILSWIEKLV